MGIHTAKKCPKTFRRLEPSPNLPTDHLTEKGIEIRECTAMGRSRMVECSGDEWFTSMVHEKTCSSVELPTGRLAVCCLDEYHKIKTGCKEQAGKKGQDGNRDRKIT